MLRNLRKPLAERARDVAEDCFKDQNIKLAMKSLKKAKKFDPQLPNIEEYMTAYKVHKLAAKESTWYKLLAINDPEVDASVIRNQYKRLELMLHPDKNPSVAADGAFKLIQSAADVLTNPEKREAYNRQLTCNHDQKISRYGVHEEFKFNVRVSTENRDGNRRIVITRKQGKDEHVRALEFDAAKYSRVTLGCGFAAGLLLVMYLFN